MHRATVKLFYDAGWRRRHVNIIPDILADHYEKSGLNTTEQEFLCSLYGLKIPLQSDNDQNILRFSFIGANDGIVSTKSTLAITLQDLEELNSMYQVEISNPVPFFQIEAYSDGFSGLVILDQFKNFFLLSDDLFYLKCDCWELMEYDLRDYISQTTIVKAGTRITQKL